MSDHYRMTALRLVTHRARRLIGGLAMAVVSTRGASAQGAPGALRLARLFGDGMVVQRDAPVAVWGWASPGTTVRASFDGHTARGAADAAGRWRVTLPASRAGGPYTLVVDGGGRQVAIRDVLVGDVWIASGQSNMELTVASAANARAEIAAAHDPAIRQLKVPVSWAERPEDDLAGGSWAPADPAHVGDFSAVAYYFARDLRATEHVPIGIVNSTWGGSGIETWLSRSANGLTDSAVTARLRAETALLDTVRERLRARLGTLPTSDSGLVGGVARWADPSLDDSSWSTLAVPSYWESAGWDGLDGVVWFRTTFTLPADEAGREARLSLGAIDDDDVTWVNGVEVGRTTGYDRPRAYRVPAGTLHAGVNVLAVRVTDGGGNGGFSGPRDSLSLDLADERKPLAGTWRWRVAEVWTRPDGQRINKIPAITWNRMIHPLLPFAIRGVIWYQGESNANTANQAAAYRAQFATMIRSWRADWAGARGKSFPFLWVQLPNFGRADSVPENRPSWAVQRESMNAALALPNTGQAITIDVGEADNIHPKDKQTVGHRLALVARKVAYGEPVLASGPTYRRYAVRGDSIVVELDHVGRGLVSRSPDGQVGAFTIAGADRRFVPARARIEGHRVVIWSDRVARPVAVRYAWANDPVGATLYNQEGLPAAPFRTDTW